MELLNLVATSNNKTLNPLTADLNEDTTQILSFVDDSPVETISLVEETPSEIVRATVYDRLRNEIVDFLSRFYLIATGTFLPTQKVGDEIVVGDVFTQLLSNPIIAAKIRNFSAIRANLRLKLVVNKDPFQQGMLLMSYLPDGNKNVTKTQMWKNSLTTATGCLRTELNFADADTVEMRIPYESTNIMRDLNSNTSSHGLYDVRVYSPLIDVSTTARASISVYACMEDVNLDFPTGYNKPPSLTDFLTHGDPVKLRKELEDLLEKIPKASRTTGCNPGCKITLQADFGDSDPNFKQKAAPNMTISGDESNNHTLYFTKQKLEEVPRVRLVEDEEKISSICSIPCYHDSFTIKTTLAKNTIVWSKPVTPYSPQATPTANVFNFDYLTFFAAMMSLWRGSITYRFRFVKTAYHSIRLRIFFVPGQVDITKCDLDACYSQIVDLATGGEKYVDFRCPYVSPYLWMNTKTGGASISQYSGTIGVSLVSELIAPDTVSPGFSTVVERYGCDDLLFAGPSALVHSPYVAKTTQLQMDTSGMEDQDFFSSTNFPSLSQKTVGKAYTSVREIITRPTIFSAGTSTTQPRNVDGFSTTSIVISPHSLLASQANTDSVDLLSYVGSIFAFYRGSVDLKVFTDADKVSVSLDPDNLVGHSVAYPRKPVFTQQLTSTDTMYLRNELTQLASTNVEGVVELNIPFIAPTIFCSALLQPNLTGTERSQQVLPLNNVVLIPDHFNYLSIFRSAGNDFSFSYLTGPPVVIANAQS